MTRKSCIGLNYEEKKSEYKSEEKYEYKMENRNESNFDEKFYSSANKRISLIDTLENLHILNKKEFSNSNKRNSFSFLNKDFKKIPTLKEQDLLKISKMFK